VTHSVLLTDDAVRDLEELDAYITAQDGPGGAEHVLAKIADAFISLEELPERGSYPPELAAIGVHEYREVFFKPYRIIYRVRKKTIYVYLVADGRRDMQSLLARRLLGA